MKLRACMQWWNNFYGRCPEGIGRHNVKMSFTISVYMSCHIFKASDWKKVGVLHRRGGHWLMWMSSTKATYYQLQQENKAIDERLSWAVPHSEPNQQKRYPSTGNKDSISHRIEPFVLNIFNPMSSIQNVPTFIFPFSFIDFAKKIFEQAGAELCHLSKSKASYLLTGRPLPWS